MRKSFKCQYTIGVNTKNKKKFLRPEDAIAEADKINRMPQSIKKVIAYKCTTCQFFHIGRSSEDLDKPIIDVPTQESEIINQPPIKFVEPHDDFDWETDKRIL